jgi:hypothetical protein
LKKILGSGFEMIRITQCESPRVFGQHYGSVLRFKKASRNEIRIRVSGKIAMAICRSAPRTVVRTNKRPEAINTGQKRIAKVSRLRI